MRHCCDKHIECLTVECHKVCTTQSQTVNGLQELQGLPRVTWADNAVALTPDSVQFSDFQSYIHIIESDKQVATLVTTDSYVP